MLVECVSRQIHSFIGNANNKPLDWWSLALAFGYLFGLIITTRLGRIVVTI